MSELRRRHGENREPDAREHAGATVPVVRLAELVRPAAGDGAAVHLRGTPPGVAHEHTLLTIRVHLGPTDRRLLVAGLTSTERGHTVMLSHDQPTPEYPMVRHQGADAHCDGFVYNRRKWPDCPKCLAAERDRYALGCPDCGSTRFGHYRGEPCSDCGSGDMTVVASP